MEAHSNKRFQMTTSHQSQHHHCDENKQNQEEIIQKQVTKPHKGQKDPKVGYERDVNSHRKYPNRFENEMQREEHKSQPKHQNISSREP